MKHLLKSFWHSGLSLSAITFAILYPTPIFAVLLMLYIAGLGLTALIWGLVRLKRRPQSRAKTPLAQWKQSRRQVREAVFGAAAVPLALVTLALFSMSVPSAPLAAVLCVILRLIDDAKGTGQAHALQLDLDQHEEAPA
jgi:hypothetical protein